MKEIQSIIPISLVPLGLLGSTPFPVIHAYTRTPQILTVYNKSLNQNGSSEEQ